MYTSVYENKEVKKMEEKAEGDRDIKTLECCCDRCIRGWGCDIASEAEAKGGYMTNCSQFAEEEVSK